MKNKWLLLFHIGYCFLRTKQALHFTAFMKKSSIIGVMLGVSLIIVLLSAMNGFEYELKNKILSVISHAEIRSIYDHKGISNWQEVIQEINQKPSIIASAPFIDTFGLLQFNNQLQPVLLRGIDLDYEKRFFEIERFLEQDTINKLSLFDDNQIILGQDIARKLSIQVGDTVRLLRSEHHKQTLDVVFFTVIGFFISGTEIDKSIALTKLSTVQQLQYHHQDVISGIRVKVEDILDSYSIVKHIVRELGLPLYILDWKVQQGHVYEDIQLIRFVTKIVLFLIILIASFNIVCSINMTVKSKAKEIAILRTMGLNAYHIVSIFVIFGLLINLVGCILGVAIGILIASYLNDINVFLEQVFQYHLLPKDIYFIDYLPSIVRLEDIYYVIFISFIITLMTSIVSSWQLIRFSIIKYLH